MSDSTLNSETSDAISSALLDSYTKNFEVSREDFLQEYINGKTVLDVDSSSNELAVAIQQQGVGIARVIAMHPVVTKEASDIPIQKPEGLTIINATRGSLPLAEASVDTIVDRNAFTSKKEFDKALPEIIRVLKEGGTYFSGQILLKSDDPAKSITRGDLPKMIKRLAGDAGSLVKYELLTDEKGATIVKITKLPPPQYKPYKIEVGGPLSHEERREAFNWFRDNPELSVHDAPDDIKILLERAELFTTCLPEKPSENWLDWLLRRDTDINLARLGENVRNALRKVAGFETGKYISDRLDEVFYSIVKVRMDRIGVRQLVFNEDDEELDESQQRTESLDTNENIEERKISRKAARRALFEKKAAKLKGTVYAENTYLSVKKVEGKNPAADAERLELVLQALLASKTNRYNVSVLPDKRDGEDYIVCIKNYDEYANRQLGNALQQVRALEDKEKFNFKFPRKKMSLFEYYKKMIQSIPRFIRKRVHRMEEHYFNISDPKALAYRISRKTMVVDDEETTVPLAAEICGFFPACRDLFRPFINRLRGDDSYNFEQNPIKGERLNIENEEENEVNITRDEAEAGNLHPTENRAYRPLERFGRYAERKALELLEDQNLFSLFIHIYQTGTEVADIGSVIQEVGIAKAREISRNWKVIRKDFKKWLEDRKMYDSSRVQIMRALSEVSKPESIYQKAA